MRILRSTIGVMALGVVTHAASAAIMFDFDSVQRTVAAGNGLGMTGGNAAIATYLNQALANGGYGGASATVSGALATATYNGEGHVIGPTLGPDTFIINNGFGIGAPQSDSFTFTFSGLVITQISFAWQIFPNASCAAGSWCSTHPSSSNWPDLTVQVNGITVFHAVAGIPQTGADPQAIGTSGVINLANFAGLANGGNTLRFIDWPAEIGIDSLQLTTACTPTGPGCVALQVPEPPSIALLALALIAAGGVARARSRHVASRV